MFLLLLFNNNVYMKNKLHLKLCIKTCLFQIKTAYIKIAYNPIFTKTFFLSPCPLPSDFILWVFVTCLKKTKTQTQMKILALVLSPRQCVRCLQPACLSSHVARAIMVGGTSNWRFLELTTNSLFCCFLLS